MAQPLTHPCPPLVPSLHLSRQEGQSAHTYVDVHGMTTAIATAVKEVVKAMPSDPVAAIGRALAGGDAPDRNATAALLSKGLQRRSTVEELHNRGIIKTQIEDKASVLNHARAADVRASPHPIRPHLAPAAPRAIRAGSCD